MLEFQSIRVEPGHIRGIVVIGMIDEENAKAIARIAGELYPEGEHRASYNVSDRGTVSIAGAWTDMAQAEASVKRHRERIHAAAARYKEFKFILDALGAKDEDTFGRRVGDMETSVSVMADQIRKLSTRISELELFSADVGESALDAKAQLEKDNESIDKLLERVSALEARAEGRRANGKGQ